MTAAEEAAAQAQLLEDVIATAQRLVKAEKDSSKITPAYIADKVKLAAAMFAVEIWKTRRTVKTVAPQSGPSNPFEWPVIRVLACVLFRINLNTHADTNAIATPKRYIANSTKPCLPNTPQIGVCGTTSAIRVV